MKDEARLPVQADMDRLYGVATNRTTTPYYVSFIQRLCDPLALPDLTLY